MVKTTLYVPGMTCANCESAVKNGLLKVEGVHAVTVSLDQASVEIQHDEKRDSDLVFRKAIKDAGYHAL